MVQSADDYRWSSHHAYLGAEKLSWLTTDFGLSVLGKTFGGARDAYQRMVNGERGEFEINPSELVQSADSRVIGTDRFLASLPPPRIQPRSQLTLDEMALEVCAALNVRLAEVRAPNRRREFTGARVQIARRAIDERIASLNQVARYLGRGSSALAELLLRFPSA
jgi:hypothetical protein